MENEQVMSLLLKLQETLDKDMMEAVKLVNLSRLSPNSVAESIRKLQLAIDFNIDVKLIQGNGNYYRISHDSGCHGDRFISQVSSISWEDNDKIPEKDEWLYVVSYSTGAYFPHSEYPQETFKEMFAELKTFEPKYCDTSNKCLYFTKDRAKKLHKEYDGIIQKYRNKVKDELERKRIKSLEEELKKLKNKDD